MAKEMVLQATAGFKSATRYKNSFTKRSSLLLVAVKVAAVSLVGL